MSAVTIGNQSLHPMLHELGGSWRSASDEHVNPYEVGPATNYPGASNIFFIPSDTYHTVRALVESIKHSDHEEIFDAATRLIGIPANMMNALGTVVDYAAAFKLLPHISCITTIALIAGMILCIIEGIVDTISLARQYSFEKEFDFEFLSHLRNMVADIDPKKTTDAVSRVAKLINEHPESLKLLLGTEQVKIVQSLMNEIQQEIKENPHLVPSIINHYRPALEEVARYSLIDNLEKMRRTYLQITADERNNIESRVKNRFPNKSEAEREALITEALEIALRVKKKKLARRIRPWMVGEAKETINPLLKGIVNGERAAIKEGLRFTDDVHVQFKKKQIVHILGIVALVFAAASLALLMVALPTTIPYLLAGVAMTFALVRAGVFSGMLETRGWSFKPKKILPASVQRILFKKVVSPPEVKHNFRESLVNPHERRKQKFTYERILDLDKQGFESQRHFKQESPFLQNVLYA